MRKLLGPAGSGQLAKMCNQIAIAGLVQGLAEAIHFGMKAGLDMEAVIEVISKGAAGSWQMENRHKTMIRNEFNFGFAVDWMRKDLGICLDQAKQTGAHLPVTALVDQFYGQVQAMGGKRWDTSSLIALLQQMSDAGWLFFLAAIPAAMLVGFSKGGLPVVGMLGVPVLSLATSPVRAAALLLPIYVVTDMFGLWAYRRAIRPPQSGDPHPGCDGRRRHRLGNGLHRLGDAW